MRMFRQRGWGKKYVEGRRWAHANKHSPGIEKAYQGGALLYVGKRVQQVLVLAERSDYPRRRRGLHTNTQILML